MKYVIGLVVVIALCTVVWFTSPTKIEVNELEEKVSTLEVLIGEHYINDISLLEDASEQLLNYNFNQPITDENNSMISKVSEEFRTITSNLLFISSNASVHSELQYRVSNVRMHLIDYVSGASLTKEEVADLYQVLQAIHFIAKYFRDIVSYDPQSTYDAMHDEEHEMVERIKYRLSIKY